MVVFTEEPTNIPAPVRFSTPGDASRTPYSARAARAAAAATADDVLALSSLERAVSGDASVGDVGALAWIILRRLVPCDSMAIFVHDAHGQVLAVEYAAGLHAPVLRGRRVLADLPMRGRTAAAALSTRVTPDGGTDPVRSCRAIPLIYDDCPVGLLALYATAADAFAPEHERLLTLLAGSLAVSIASVLEVEPPAVAIAPPPRKPATHLRLVHTR